MREVLGKFSQENFFAQEHYDYLLLEDYKNPLQKSLSQFKLKETSNDKEFFLKNYSNVLCYLEYNSVIVVVEKYDNKVSFKLFQTVRRRGLTKRFFKTTKQLYYVTVNLKTGNIYNGRLFNYHKKKSKHSSIQKNYFTGGIIRNLTLTLRSSLGKFNLNERNEIIKEIIRKFFEEIFGKDVIYDGENPDELLFKFYLNNRGIKYPNNFETFKYLFNTPNLSKILKQNIKKCDYKMVDAIMKTFKLKGDLIKRVLHKINHFNFELYSASINFFGDMVKQNEELSINILNSSNIHLNCFYDQKENFSKQEIKKIFNLFKDYVLTKKIHVITFSDHFSMYDRIKRYGEIDLKWKSFDKNSFNEEHLDWSDKVSKYLNGTYVREYSNSMKEDLVEIKDLNFTYYPILLDSSREYNKESVIQSNCVRSYIDKPSSIIISLRKGHTESEDRATIEYNVYKGDNFIDIKRIQTRGKFNSNLDKSWNEVLEKLDEIVYNWKNNKDVLNFKVIRTDHKNNSEAVSSIENNFNIIEMMDLIPF